MLTRRFILVLGILLPVLPTSAQKLVDLVPSLYGGDGITLATLPAASHEAHFSIASAASINRLNQRIAAEVGSFPVTSSVGGFSFEFDPVLGDFVSTTSSLGPLVGERATTAGKGQLNVNVSFTSLSYNEFGGRDLGSFDVTARHDPDLIGFPDVFEQFEQDVIRITMDLDISAQLIAVASTYGVTDNLDVGILVPFASVDVDVRSDAVVVEAPANTLFPNIHTFDGGPESAQDRVQGDASGVGDLMVRAKYHWRDIGNIQVAGATQVRLATGDEDDFLGSGDNTVLPSLVLSTTRGAFSPHLNLGYEFNLDTSDQSSIEYALGFDAGSGKYTVAAELLGSHEIDGDDIGDDILDTALGFKWNAGKGLLVGANARLPINDQGLRSSFISTISLEYGF